MADWNDGYVTDITYTSGYHTETCPVWIATVATLLGFASPDPTGAFRYVDLGCGNGITALIVAAAMPHAEVWGFDFNPAHIAFGRDIARRAGLTNIHFEEASFDDIARLPSHDLPMFDYISAHGVLSWISLENRRRLFDVIGQRLASGGIAYISYNVATGWAGMPPVRALMRLLTEASPQRTDVAASGVFETLERMKNAGAAMFQAHPGIEQRLAVFRARDQRYVAHELLNRDWHPVMFQPVAAAMAAIKCDYIGSATPRDNIPGLTIPATLQAMLAEVQNTGLRETLRDLASGNPFRRDLYQRGPRRLSAVEFERKVNGIALTRTLLPVPDTIVMDSLLGQFTASDPIYRALLAALDAGPMTIGQLFRQENLLSANPDLTREAVTLLITAGYLAPLLAVAPTAAAADAVARLNKAHAALFDDGHDLPFLAYSALGGGWHADPLDILAVDELRIHPDLEERTLAEAVADRLTRTGRQLHHDGQPITEPLVARERAINLTTNFVRERLPLMRQLGVPSPRMAETG